MYSVSGELLQTYSTDGDSEAGLAEPFICDDDDDGSVLIADRFNSRLQVMTKQGEFSVVDLQPRVSKPRAAVLFNNYLYVISGEDVTLKKYVNAC